MLNGGGDREEASHQIERRPVTHVAHVNYPLQRNADLWRHWRSGQRH